MKQRLVNTFLLVLAFLACKSFCDWRTDAFRFSDISNAFRAKSETKELSILHLPKGPYRLIDSGLQCYVFVSPDETSILKVFRHHPYHLKPHANPIKQFSTVITSLEITQELLKDETGSLYLHPKPTTHLKQEVTLIDRIGNTYSLDLDTAAFAVQKKGLRAQDYIKKLLDKENLAEAKAALRDLFSLTRMIHDKGIVDLDPKMHRNLGFIDDQAVELDIGAFQKPAAPPSWHTFRHTLIKETEELREWLSTYSQEMVTAFDEALVEALL